MRRNDLSDGNRCGEMIAIHLLVVVCACGTTGTTLASSRIKYIYIIYFVVVMHESCRKLDTPKTPVPS